MRSCAWLAAPLMALALMLTGCGHPQRDLIDRALHTRITDADLRLAVRFHDGPRDLVRFTASGPYHSEGANNFPEFDFRMRLELHLFGAHGRIPMRAVSDGTNFWFVLRHRTFELGAGRIVALEADAASRPHTDRLGDLERAGVDFGAWFPHSETIGDEVLRGEKVTHVRGQLDVSAMLENIGKLLGSPAVRRRLNFNQGNFAHSVIERFDREVSDPVMDVYVGQKDGGFRRITGTMRITPAKVPLRGTLDVRLDLANVGEHNAIVNAPEAGSGEPMDALVSAFDHEADRLYRRPGTGYLTAVSIDKIVNRDLAKAGYPGAQASCSAVRNKVGQRFGCRVAHAAGVTRTGGSVVRDGIIAVDPIKPPATAPLGA